MDFGVLEFRLRVFINEDNSRQEHSGDSTRRPAFPAADDRGFKFHPFEVPRRELLVNELPESPLSLFQHFIAMSIVKEWSRTRNDRKVTPQCLEANHDCRDHLQQATTELCEPGSHLAVDEAMIRYTGRNKQVTRVPNKPVDTGFKVWIAAQLGIFMRWIWHQPGARYGPVGVQKKPASQKKRIKGKIKGSSKTDKVEDVIYVATEAKAKIVALNSTQSVVIALINLLPISTYHVFVDNLFSLPDLFRSFRQHGHGATGTARSNCGIYNGLVEAKKADKAGKSGFQFNEIKVIPTANNQVNQVAWKDNALVLFLSTVFAGGERTERWRRRPSTKTPTARPIRRFFGSEPAKLISIPTIAASYNDEMNHVDRSDQRRPYLGYDHPMRRGAWQAIAWTFLLDVVLVNSFLLQLHGQPAWNR
ncbi:hypothetical protein HZ326_29546 [Fusarium oxysporum f. sp. albedinis]|nr:hypothetical protein HZ326_29546 [Fusarium oxysporum f. sp. albedinis]